jgi:hypothetical protein
MQAFNKHWVHGGTVVTNFDEEDRPLYEAAIKEYGDADLFISDTPMPPKTWGASLHDLRGVKGRKGGLGAFWRVFDELKGRQNPA